MSDKKKSLGRGLDVLLGGAKLDVTNERLRVLSLGKLAPGTFQPRKEMDESKLQELANSISAQGVVQPVVVREVDADRYEIIAGERRWRAAKLAGLSEIPAIVRKVSDQAALAIALIENIQREDLNAMEEAEALKRLLDEYRMTHQQLADAVGKSRATVSNLMRLNDLDDSVKDMLMAGKLEMGHARALLSLELSEQVSMAQRIAEEQLTVRDVEALVQNERENSDKFQKPSKAISVDPDIRRLQDEVSAHIGASVMIRHGIKGTGRLIIKYSSLEELDGVIDRLRKDLDH